MIWYTIWRNNVTQLNVSLPKHKGLSYIEIAACSSIFIQLISLLDNKLCINVEVLRLTCWTANAGLQTDFYLQELVIAISGESHRCTAGRWASRRSPCFEVSGSRESIMLRHETASASHVRLTITYRTFRFNITRFCKLCDLLCDEFSSADVNPLSFLLHSLMNLYLKEQGCVVCTVFYDDQSNKLSALSASHKLNNGIQNTPFILSWFMIDWELLSLRGPLHTFPPDNGNTTGIRILRKTWWTMSNERSRFLKSET